MSKCHFMIISLPIMGQRDLHNSHSSLRSTLSLYAPFRICWDPQYRNNSCPLWQHSVSTPSHLTNDLLRLSSAGNFLFLKIILCVVISRYEDSVVDRVFFEDWTRSTTCNHYLPGPIRADNCKA